MFIELSKLKHHEEIDLKHLEKLKKRIIKDGYIKDPIIVDKNYNIIIDGHHRVEILKELSCLKAPVHYIDYLNEEIKIQTWYPAIKLSENEILKIFNGKISLLKNGDNINNKCILQLYDKSFIINSDRNEIMKNLLKNIEIKYFSSKYYAMKLLKERKINGFIILPSVTKEDVLKTVFSNKKFPPKTTRHIIKNKPKNWYIPFSLLK
ncbi:MAG: ParB N-terminal domain-containing protein [Nitrososphaerota archaeon]